MRPTLLGLVTALALAACGDDDATTDTATTDTTTTDTSATDTSNDADATTPLPGAGIPWPGWDAGTVYFVIVDRFFDGDPGNNTSYGRQPDGAGEIATFHGGDFVGLTQKLEEGYFLALGVSAIWVTAPYEQIHGWVVAGSHRHYAYHGYYPLDFTRMDANFGTDDEFGTFVDAAHAQGIRVVMDVVMNHAGYATTADLDAFEVDVLKPGWESATPATLYDYIDFQSPSFADWWGPKWVRAELGGGYPAPDASDLKKTVDYLPDFLTESTETGIGLPPFYAKKGDTRAVHLPDATVRGHLVAWLTTWVRTYGIDGFRCDTAKHVELPAWQELKDAGDAALRAWRAEHPDKAFPDADYPDPERPFWMTGEVFPHGVVKDVYFDSGFDSLINFDFQAAAAAAIDDPKAIDATYADYATRLADPDFDVLSYLSSHDTSLFFERSAGKSADKQKRAGTLLLMAPGGVQIFYGDENARGHGAVTDAAHRTRTDYAWGEGPDVLAHWQKVGRFRKSHPAIGAGAHVKIADAPYTFARTRGDDRVVVVIGASGATTVAVGPHFADGVTLRDAYTGATADVAAGSVTVTADASGVLLLERAP
ncbi:MAG: alpha-amylase [Deltaproteobacteria bacterium]|nr:alpha-amylase [Deltaproteobacteria bacterium]